MAIQRDLDCMPFAAASCRQYAKTLEAMYAKPKVSVL